MTAAMQIAHRICQSRASVASCTVATIVLSSFLVAGCGNHPLNTINVAPAIGATVLTSKGQQAQFTATGQYGSSNRLQTTKDVTASVTWTSSVPSVATIGATGMAIAVSDGTTVITASMSGDLGMETGTSNVTVTGTGNGTGTGTRTLASIAISPTTQALTGTGQTGQFTAIGTFTGGAPATVDMTSLVAWSSSNVGVATVSASGLATAVGNGTTMITAMARAADGSVITSTATVQVTVTPPVTRVLTSLQIFPSSQTVTTVGETGQFIAIGSYSGGIPLTADLTSQVTWGSSDVTVANINSSGLATAVPTAIAGGASAITAKYIDPEDPTKSVIVGSAALTFNGSSPVNTLPILTVYEVGTGMGTVTSKVTSTVPSSPTSVTCASVTESVPVPTCTGNFPSDATVTLTADPSPGSVFGGWSSNCIPVPGDPLACTISMTNPDPITLKPTTANQTVGVVFNR
jgi:hypothetical protein